SAQLGERYCPESLRPPLGRLEMPQLPSGYCDQSPHRASWCRPSLSAALLALLHASVDDAAIAWTLSLVRSAHSEAQLRVWSGLEVDRLAQTLGRHGQRVHLARAALQALAVLQFGVDALYRFL